MGPYDTYVSLLMILMKLMCKLTNSLFEIMWRHSKQCITSWGNGSSSLINQCISEAAGNSWSLNFLNRDNARLSADKLQVLELVASQDEFKPDDLWMNHVVKSVVCTRSASGSNPNRVIIFRPWRFIIFPRISSYDIFTIYKNLFGLYP